VSEEALGTWETGRAAPHTWLLPRLARLFDWHLGELDPIVGAPAAPPRDEPAPDPGDAVEQEEEAQPPEPPQPAPTPAPGAGRDGRALARRLAAWIGRRLRWSGGQDERGGRDGGPSLVPGWERPAGFPAPRFRLRLSREPDPVRWAYPVLRTDRDYAACLWRLLADYECEALAAIYLDDDHRLIGGLVAHVGSRDRVAAEPRRLLAGALLCNAWWMAVGHNHPGESSSPSPGDRHFTRQLARAAEALGVELVGHFVLTEVSFARADP
jgi:hypothetical protein